MCSAFSPSSSCGKKRTFDEGDDAPAVEVQKGQHVDIAKVGVVCLAQGKVFELQRHHVVDNIKVAGSHLVDQPGRGKDGQRRKV